MRNEVSALGYRERYALSDLSPLSRRAIRAREFRGIYNLAGLLRGNVVPSRKDVRGKFRWPIPPLRSEEVGGRGTGTG